jgi:hypothetical protein
VKISELEKKKQERYNDFKIGKNWLTGQPNVVFSVLRPAKMDHF